MEAPAEPAAKRQRREPAWKAGFIDPSKLKTRDLKGGVLPAATVEADGTLQQPQQQPASSSPSGPPVAEEEEGTQILQTRLVDNNTVELVVLHGGRKYRGTLDRTALPAGVGVSARVSMEELTAARTGSHSEQATSMCALCNTPLEVPPVMGMDDKAGVYLKVRITSNWTARVHLQCAVWCPECVEDPAIPGFYHFMGPAVRRGRALRCKTCKERGATVGCFQEGCPAVYHLSCAVNSGCEFDEVTKEVWCPSHR